VKHVHISAQTKYKVTLTPEETRTLQTLIHKGTIKARIITRVRILLLADQGKTDAVICKSLNIVRSVVYDTRKHYATGGLTRALYDLPRPGKQRTLTGVQEAEVTAIACSNAPKGYRRWTLDLLTEKVRSKMGVTIGRTAIWKVLLRNNEKPWLKKNVVYSQSNRGI
jgi:transposase